MLTDMEFSALLDYRTKRILGDILWLPDEDHSPCTEFRAEVRSDGGWPLFVKGTFNPLVPALSYTLILKTEGRIYGLDLGKAHHNPQCDQVGECHKHRWCERFRDKEAYVPVDITASAQDPVAVWRQFCLEAGLTHEGEMRPPPPTTGDLFW